MSPEADAADACGVPGCGAPADRHLSLAEARRVFTQMPEKGRRAPLCRDHYREWKKATKQARKLDRLGW
ncbi:MAG TPA: hypothetical protein VMG99_00435 [Thermoplasmata archaeon]|nr:hypothetical protein [Thermoplasmata archaeon]